MERIDLEGFFFKNRILMLSVLGLALLAAAGIFGARYYYGNMNKKAEGLLWKGVRLYMSFNGKNPKTLSDSVSYLKKLQAKFRGTDASALSNFYMGLDYLRMGRPNKASSYLAAYVKLYPKPGHNNMTYLAYSNLASAALIKKDYKGAITDFSNMSKIGNLKLQEYARLEEAAVYSEINEKGKAVAIYKSMLTGDSMTNERGYIENLIQLNS